MPFDNRSVVSWRLVALALVAAASVSACTKVIEHDVIEGEADAPEETGGADGVGFEGGSEVVDDDADVLVDPDADVGPEPDLPVVDPDLPPPEDVDLVPDPDGGEPIDEPDTDVPVLDPDPGLPLPDVEPDTGPDVPDTADADATPDTPDAPDVPDVPDITDDLPLDAGDADTQDAEDVPDVEVDPICGLEACTAQGAECGEVVDECGDTIGCGSCHDAGDQCVDNLCVCAPHCGAAVCGDDGCGGLCGTCPDGSECVGGACTCVPDCPLDAECGDDGCGGVCGTCLPGDSCGGYYCNCTPHCDPPECGDDGCGGSCGTCESPDTCQAGECVCIADCTGKECGHDGCTGVCGSCEGAQDVCIGGECVCQPTCSGKVCGTDGCDGSCGSCVAPDTCQGGLCLCNAKCAGAECGDDGCGGSCGDCGQGTTCESGTCVDVTLSCENVSFEGCCSVSGEVYFCEDDALQTIDCPSDLCGWNAQADFYDCNQIPAQGPAEHPYLCLGESCPDPCGGLKECGYDCGQLCGTCSAGTTCDNHNICVPCSCDGKECGDDGCGNSCGSCGSGMACSAVTGQCSNLVPTTCFGAVMCLDGSYAGGTPCWTQSGSTQTQCAEDCGDVVADPAEQTIFASLKSCVEGNGCLNPSDPVANTQESTACSATACSSQLASCLAGGSFGSGSCPALASCLNGCSTTTCQKGCYQSATANSAAEYLALLGCVFDACPGLVASCVQSAQLSNGACYQENLDCQNP